MAGIYLHIPFCRQACTYCDFHFSTNLKRKDDMVAALLGEVRLRKDFFPDNTPIRTIYFGGGTPSVLSSHQIHELIESLQQQFSSEAILGIEKQEITLECNPDDLNPTFLREMKAAGINRLSIGVQAFDEELLRLLNRSHNAAQALDGITMAQEAGFDNLTVDLIYGIPGLDMAAWEAQVKTLIEAGVPHVSAYALTVEEKTALHNQVRKGDVHIPEDSVYTDQFFRLIDLLEGAGYIHYELSNFALPGFHSQHNSSYWKGNAYLGLGPSAHSFDGATRSWNVKNNARYLKLLEDELSPVEESEVLSKKDQLNEYIMIGLRLAEGIDLVKISDQWKVDLLELEAEKIATYIEEGWMLKDKSQLRLSRAGKMVSDHIIAELFQV